MSREDCRHKLPATLKQLISRLRGHWGRQGLLAKLSGTSTLALGTAAAVGIILVGFVAAQGWPALPGTGGSPETLIDLGSAPDGQAVKQLHTSGVNPAGPGRGAAPANATPGGPGSAGPAGGGAGAGSKAASDSTPPAISQPTPTSPQQPSGIGPGGSGGGNGGGNGNGGGDTGNGGNGGGNGNGGGTSPPGQ